MEGRPTSVVKPDMAPGQGRLLDELNEVEQYRVRTYLTAGISVNEAVAQGM